MSAGHTPGPWRYRPYEYDDWGIVRAPVTEPGRFHGGIICQARDPEVLDEITLNQHRSAKTDPWEANARLIAAAPDLLEAAPDAADILEHYAEYIRGVPADQLERHPYLPEIERVAASLRAAAVKAVGGAS